MKLELDPWAPLAGVTYVKACSNCSVVDKGDTVDELEIAMANHICEVE